MIKLIAFDFDGTLFDTKKIIFNATSNAIKERGYKFKRKDKLKIGNGSLKEYFKEIGIKKDKKIIEENIKKEMFRKYQKAKPVRSIKSINNLDARKLILSNNNEKFIKKLLNEFQIKTFGEIYGIESSKGKTNGLKRIMKRHKLKKEEILYVGDRARDAVNCKEAGVYCAIILNKTSWGIKNNVIKESPDFIISNLKQIKNIVTKLNSS